MSGPTEANNETRIFSNNDLFEMATQNSNQYYICIHENVYDVTEFLDEVK